MSTPEPTRETFVPYATMFKVEELSPLDIATRGARQLQCINCGELLKWRTYILNPIAFDTGCHICHKKAPDFWEGKLYKRLEEDA